MNMTAHKAVAAFITSLIALVGVFGISTGWASPTLIDAVSAILGAVLTAVVTYMVPNTPKA
jgi:VIT1/CCC1 family predicted Fe2+/Mn2+ transporter